MGLLIVIGFGALAFIGGVLVGAHNAGTVDNSIATIKAAQANAEAMLAKITAHKAS